MASSRHPAVTDSPASWNHATQRRYVFSAAAVAFGIAFAQSVAELKHNAEHFPPLFMAAFLVAAAGLVALFAVGWMRGILRRWTILAFAATLLLTIYVLPLVGGDLGHERFTPLPMRFVSIAMGLAPIAMGVRRAAAYSAVLLGGVQWVHLYTTQSAVEAWLQTCVYAGYGALFLVVIAIAENVLAEAETAAQSSAQAGEVVALQSQESASRDWWNGLIHDKILGALRLGAIATTPEIAGHSGGLAREALAAIEQQRVKFRDDIVGELQATARELGLQLVTRVTGVRSPLVVGEAALEALSEALVNVRRHAGTERVMLIGDIDDYVVDLSIIDEGVGFEPSAIPVDRLGLRRSVQGRMTAVGGRATISSHVGHGTAVRVSWSAGSSAAPRERWPALMFRPLLAVFAAHWALHLILALRLPDIRDEWYVLAASALVLSAATILCWYTQASKRWLYGLAIVGLVTEGLLMMHAHLTHEADYHLWFGGYLMPLCLSLALRGARFAGYLCGLGSLAVALVIVSTRDPDALVATAGVMSVPAMFSLIGHFFYVALSETSDRAEVYARARATLDLERRILTQRRLVRDERLRELRDRVVPLLRELAHEPEPHPHRRERCERVERLTRDLLVARPLLTAETRMALERARQRGAKVTLVAEMPVEGGPEGQLEEGEEIMDLARRALVPLLDAAGRGSALRVMLDLSSDQDGKMTLVSPRPGDLGSTMRRLERLAVASGRLGILSELDRIEVSLTRERPALTRDSARPEPAEPREVMIRS